MACGNGQAHHGTVPSPRTSGPDEVAAATDGAETLARLAATRPWRRFTTDVTGPGWVRLADRIADPAGMDAWVATEVAGTAKGHRDLAGSLIVYRLAGSLAELAIVPLLSEHRVLHLSPERLWLSFGENARIDAIGLPTPTVMDLADDPAGALPVAAAEGLVTTFAGVATAVRARAPFGLAGIWGTLADHVADVALRWSRDGGADPDRAWTTANAVIDAISGHPESRLRARPSRDDVTSPAGTAAFITRGTCCLIYKCHEPAPGEPATTQARIDAAACTSCPLRPDADRHARWSRLLTQRAN